MQQDLRYNQAKKVTLIGAVLNAFLGVLKVIGGIFYHSHALVADGIHSFSDLLADIMVIFASKYGSQDADYSHPYGHQRIETAATFMLSLFLILAGAGIAWDSLTELFNHYTTRPSYVSLAIALISILINEGLFHYTKKIGREIKSDLVTANAWHHRSDAASSIVVFFGLIGALAGFAYLDAIAAVIVGCMVIKMGWEYGWNSIKELVDSAVDPQTLQIINNTIKSVKGVGKVHQLRTRMMGPDIYIDVHILVDPMISVSEGHFIAQHVHQALLQNLDKVKDVTVHVDPEDDETSCPSLHLPNRSQLEKVHLKIWQQQIPQITSWVVHYLDGKIMLDIFISEHLNDKNYTYLQQELNQIKNIASIRLFHHLGTVTLAK